MSMRWKRNAAVGAMVVLVCAAVGLNWRYAGRELEQTARLPVEEPAGSSSGKLLGEATLVSGSDTPERGDTGLVTDEAAVYTGADYFASARLTRQQARDSAITLLQEAAAQENADEDVLNGASEGIQVLASYTLKEAQIENLVTAKGYQDCVAFLGDDSVSVVVANGQKDLSTEDVARIADIAMSETGLPASGVRIMAAN